MVLPLPDAIVLLCQGFTAFHIGSFLLACVDKNRAERTTQGRLLQATGTADLDVEAGDVSRESNTPRRTLESTYLAQLLPTFDNG